jgi:hypothetical protein
LKIGPHTIQGDLKIAGGLYFLSYSFGAEDIRGGFRNINPGSENKSLTCYIVETPVLVPVLPVLTLFPFPVLTGHKF